MNCGENFNHGQCGCDTCGKKEWGYGAVSVCPKCRDKLMLKLYKLAGSSELGELEVAFLSELADKYK